MQLKSGTLLQNGKYRIVRFINSGGFGCTYEAIHTMFDEKVAIKEFFVKDFCNRDAQTRHVTVGTHSKKALVERLKVKFIEEAKSIRKLRHNGVVRVNDVFEENGTAYYVMDYIEGESLKEKVETRGHLTESEAIRYIRQVSDTLGYVHSKNILHLDIKPGNIMIDRDDNVILIDFGTSKQYDEVDGENTSTLMGKTPGYAPLEQMSNSVQKFYPATDIYALGATLYKMLSGVTPVDAILRASGRILESLPADINKATKNVVEQSMRLNKDERLQSIAEFLRVLDGGEVVESEGTIRAEIAEDTENPKSISYKNEIFNVNGVKFKMIAVKGGTFQMGATTELIKNSWPDELPVHGVTLSDYYIGETTVTQELWESVMSSNPSRYKGLQRPVERVSWDDCQQFVKRLKELTGRNFRLPTESEWEYAARGGLKRRRYVYSGSNKLSEVGWYNKGFGGTRDVKTKSPNELGIYDMSGNVLEWCHDWKCKYGSDSQINPTGPISGSYRVLRGGWWSSIAMHCRVSHRCKGKPGIKRPHIGFRLAL